MAATKTMFVHFVDGGSSMKGQFPLIKSIISSFTLQRMMASKTVECGVVCKENDIELRRPSLTTLQEIQQMQQQEDLVDDLVDGLRDSYETLMTTNEGKKFNRVLIMYTNGDTSVNNKKMKSLQCDIVDNGVLFYLLVVCDQSQDDVNTTRSDNISQLQDFTQSVGGNMTVCHDLQSGLKFLSAGPGLGSRPMQSKILFEIAPTMKLSCVYCTKTTKVPLPSLKKQSNLSYDEDIPDSGKVSTNYIYRNPTDPDEELEFEERVKGYRYGPQYIPMGGLDENILKLISEPVLRLLGFIPASSIARHHFLASSFVLGVAAGDNNDGTRRAIGALSQALKSQKQVALCRLVKRANADPWLVVLLPNPDGTLLMHRLPCSEDIRNFLFPPLTSMSDVSSLQQQSVAAAVDSMTVPKLKPDDLLMVNPSTTAFLSQLQENAGTINGPLAGIENYDNTFKALGDHPTSAKVWSEVKGMFQLAPTDQSSRDKKKRKQYWSDFDIVSGTGESVVDSKVGIKSEDTTTESSQKQMKLENHHPVPPVLSEGSVNPVEDLDSAVKEFLIAKESNASNISDVQTSVISSLNVMERIVELLVLTGGTSAHYRKAVGCLKKLRETSLIDFGNSSSAIVERFNSFVKTNIKNKFKGGRHDSFWKGVVAASLSLIHTDEGCCDSGVSVSESQAFLTEAVENVKIEVPEVKEEEEEEDDLFGDMA